MTISVDHSDDAWPPPVLWPTLGRTIWISGSGEIEDLSRQAIQARLQNEVPIVCHARAAARRIGIPDFPAFDILELFAFVRPAQFCVPTPDGLAAYFGLPRPDGPISRALLLLNLTEHLLDELSDQSNDPSIAVIALMMRDCGWTWSASVAAALDLDDPAAARDRSPGPAIWQHLPEWSEYGPESASGNKSVERDEARSRLTRLLGSPAEPRPSQADYAAAATDAFLPREQEDEPNVVLAEAGTGVGKTLGYIAPASVWAEKNSGPVWISTYTRNLQHQIDSEFDRLHRDPVSKSRKVVIRKGRENYLCLLNLEEAMSDGFMGFNRQDGTALGLMARWAVITRDGDMVGGDFPAWLADLLGRNHTLGLTDRRGECLYSTCPHYNKCFVEKSIRLAQRADVVIANHALVMYQAAGGLDEANMPSRYVFDEGHHIFDAADGAFSANLSGAETAELRGWLSGTGTRRRSRARGLETRIGDLLGENTGMRQALNEILTAAQALPGDGWLSRIQDGAPRGPTEMFLTHVRRQIIARNPDADAAYSIETEVRPQVDNLLESAQALDRALHALLTPVLDLRGMLGELVSDESRDMETPERIRIEATVRALTRRGEETIGSWRSMLEALSDEQTGEFVDWFEIERSGGRDRDIGMRRHWLDPTVPLHNIVMRPAQGILVTSATLRDASGDAVEDWRAAEMRTGAIHLPKPAVRVSVASPFDYSRQTRVFIVQDVDHNNPNQVAAAYRELFLASRGGALGLFTAIRRLRQVHERIAADVDSAGYPLYAQHIDGLDLATLIEIFRADEEVCLLGTDGVRDGVDVPGRSLRLITFDRVPWPRQNILYKARFSAFGRYAYSDMLTRLKLKQAFGRLIRRADDHGVFVLLDRRMPSRLLGAFPAEAPVRRCGLAETVAAVETFLHRS